MSPFFEFARFTWEPGPLASFAQRDPSKPKVCFLGGTQKKFAERSLLHFANLFWEELRPQSGAQCEAEDQAPLGAGIAPEAVTEHKTGYKTAHTLQSKVFICTRVAEVRRNGGAIRADISSARTAIVGTDVADRKDLIRLLQDAQGHTEQASRNGRDGHR